MDTGVRRYDGFNVVGYTTSICTETIVMVRGRKVKLFRGGAGPRLLFLHDSFCPGWLAIHEKLAAEFDVLVPIHPGFSGSEENFDDFNTMEDLLFHYLDLCEALQLDRPILSGASFGGWLAAEWAVRYGAMLSKLILIDPLGLRVEGSPAADILSFDSSAMRQALFGVRIRIWRWKLFPTHRRPKIW